MKYLIISLSVILLNLPSSLNACTGLSLKAKDGAYVQARTIEWGSSDLPSEYVIIPRGQQITSYTPTGVNGAVFQTKYGVVGLAIMRKEFIAEGLNEAGLSAGLFYFPRYGSYVSYNPAENQHSVNDLQLVTWMLSQFSTIDEIKAALPSIRIIGIDQTAGSTSTVHWRIGEPSGRQVVLEIVDGIPHFYENPVGVLTNAPGFEWHLTNLNNYVNLTPGGVAPHALSDLTLAPFGSGAGFLGIPGDITPPSRFVRIAFYRATAPQRPTALETILECFHILNNFDIPIGIEHPLGQSPDIPSATQWTSATDLTNRKIYYKTAYNSTIRCIDLQTIDFAATPYQSFPLDATRQQPIEYLNIK